MVQQLRVLGALAEDHSSVLSSHIEWLIFGHGTGIRVECLCLECLCLLLPILWDGLGVLCRHGDPQSDDQSEARRKPGSARLSFQCHFVEL